MLSNTERIIPSGLSLISWHTKRDGEGNVAVHIDVGFEVGKFGGKSTDKVEFELSLKRAEVVILCLDGAKPLFSTISRKKRPQKTRNQEVKKTIKGETSANAEAKFSAPISLDIHAAAKGTAEYEKTTSESIAEAVSEFLVRHRKTHDGHISWEVLSSEGKTLDGNPWEAEDEPRMKVHMPVGALNEPYIRVEVRCRGEDLDFGEGIRLKDPKERNFFSMLQNSDKNKAAAEQYLKSILETEGLKLDAPGEKYGDITIADMVVTVE